MAITEVLPDFSAVSPAQCCQAFFVSASAFVAGLFVLPEAARRTLMDYGARRPKDGASEETAARESALTRFLAVLTSYGQVPHSWFLHYYIVSVSWSAFWAWQYLTHGSVMAAMAQRQDRAGESSLDLGSVFVAWALLALQGGRRLYETLYVSKPSNSTMWFAHWVLGLLYYTSNGISVWIEGSGAILASWESPEPVTLLTPRILSGLALYVFACYKQNECHRHLASLVKYTLPSQGWFEYLLCPHYTCECLIYIAIAYIAAPPGSSFNRSVLGGLLFVTVNLAATAHGTKQWYADKFGADEVAARWIMIPFLY